jgi:hypothetical protein
MLLAFALRLFRLGAASLWYDEAVSVFLARQDLATLTAHTAGDIHPPFYYYLLHFWLQAAGSSELAASFLSLFFGLLLVAMAYTLGRRLFSSAVGLLAALLVALSPFNLWYSQEVRMYTLGAFLGMITLYCLIEFLEQEGESQKQRVPGVRRVQWLGYVVAATLGLYTLYYFGVLLVFENLYVVWRLVLGVGSSREASRAWEGEASPPSLSGKGAGGLGREARRLLAGPTGRAGLWPWLVAQAAVVLLYLPWLPVAVRQITQPPVPPWRGFVSLWDVLIQSWTALSLGQSVLAPSESAPWTQLVQPPGMWLALLLFAALYVAGLRRPPSYQGPSKASISSWRAQRSNLSVWDRLLRRYAPRNDALHLSLRAQRSNLLLLAGYTIVPLALIYLISLVVPIFHVRYVFLYATPFYLVLAAGLAPILSKFNVSGRARLRRLAPLAALVALGVVVAADGYAAQRYFFDPQYVTDDQRAAVRHIAAQVRPGDAVLINAGYVYPTFVYYYPEAIAWRGRLTDYPQVAPGRFTEPPAAAGPAADAGVVVLQTGSIGGSQQLGWGNPQSDFYATTEEATAAALAVVAQRHERLWVLRCYDTVTDPDEFIRRYLDEHFLKLDDVGMAGQSFIRVQGYRTRPPNLAVSPPQHPLDVTLGEQVRLLGFDLSLPHPLSPTLYLTLYWQPQTKPSQDYHAFVSLMDTRGQEWGHWDSVPIAPLYPSSRWAVGEVLRHPWRLDLPLGTPPGEYHLRAGLYRPDTGQRLPVTDAQGRVLGSEVTLGPLSLPQFPPPDPRSIVVPHPLRANLGDEVALLGYELGQRQFQPGQSIELWLFWQALRQPEDYVVFVQLLDQAGKPWAAVDTPPVGGTYPTTRWQKGEVVRDHYALAIAADAPDGSYRLIAGLYRASDKRRLPLTGLFARGDAVDLGTVQVQGRQRVFAAPAIPHQLSARLGSSVELLGYDLSGAAAKPVETLQLTLYWRALGTMGQSYTVFVQMLDAGNQIIGQHDGLPGEGALPTTGWVQGEVLTDRHTVSIKPDAARGEYRLVVGMYVAATGERLPAFDVAGQPAGDMIELGRVRVE